MQEALVSKRTFRMKWIILQLGDTCLPLDGFITTHQAGQSSCWHHNKISVMSAQASQQVVLYTGATARCPSLSARIGVLREGPWQSAALQHVLDADVKPIFRAADSGHVQGSGFCRASPRNVALCPRCSAQLSLHQTGTGGRSLRLSHVQFNQGVELAVADKDCQIHVA